MINVNDIKVFFEFILNKNQVGGNTTPSDFNTIVNQAQLDLYNEYYNAQYDRGLVAKRGYEINQAMTDFFNPFHASTLLNLTKVGVFAQVNLPANYIHKSSAYVETYTTNEDCEDCSLDCEETGYGVVRFIMENQKGAVLKSKIAPATINFPFGRVEEGKLKILPNTVTSVTFNYLRLPVTLKWEYTSTAPLNRPVYNPLLSVNSEMSPVYFNELIAKMLVYKGINIREQQVQQYAEMQDQKA